MVRESGGEGLVGYRGMAVSRIRNARWKHMTKPADLHAKCIAEPAYAAAYAEAEYAGIGAMFQAQAEAGLTQEALAKRMGMMQPAIARLEGGRGLPLVETLRRHAKAVGKRLRVEMVQGGDGVGVGPATLKRKVARKACAPQYRSQPQQIAARVDYWH